MTDFVAKITDRDEAEIAIASGADMLELSGPQKLDAALLQPLLAAVAGRSTLAAYVGTPSEAADARALRIGTLLIDVDPGPALEAFAAPLRPTSSIAVVHADNPAILASLPEIFPRLVRAGFGGILVDVSSRGQGRLLDHMDIAALASLADVCGAAGLTVGFSGGLEAPDIARLLPLRPATLHFDKALREPHETTGRYDPKAMRIIRDLIPTGSGERALPSQADRKIDRRLHAEAHRDETDRVFVHDVVLPVAIGVYDVEQGRTQRVRFNVDVEIRRLDHHVADMRDVFSYDLILDSIRLLAGRGHVGLVETLAEDLAGRLLAHPRVENVTIRVEKLDVIEGAVGVEIKRRRNAQSALRQLFGKSGETPAR